MTILLCALLAAAAPIYQMPKADVDTFLAELAAGGKPYGERVHVVADRYLGAPYVNGPLGEGPNGTHDKDPLMDLQHVDCVTFVEQTLALAASKSQDDAFDLLQKIRYKDGHVDFGSRNHFMIADWVANNAFCKDVSEDLGVPTKALTRVTSRKDFFAKRVNAPELGQDIPDQTITIAYVPVSEAAAAAKKIPSPSLICFIGKIDWLFTLHCGLYLRDEHGAGAFYQASSGKGVNKVVKSDLAEAIGGFRPLLGIYRIPPERSAGRREEKIGRRDRRVER